MTGYGLVRAETENFGISIEIKAINSKYLDLYLKTGSLFSDKDIELRNLIGQQLVRGKISFVLSYTNKNTAPEQLSINEANLRRYYETLFQTAKSLHADTQDIFRIAMMLPDAYNVSAASCSEEEWQQILAFIKDTLTACNDFRLKEGKTMETMFRECIQNLRNLLDAVEEKDPERMSKMRLRLEKQMGEWLENENFDKNRFEQELIYYAEKLDINEEKVRLRSHLDYFVATLNDKDTQGKKLNFIAQEIGREINTIGSKANDAAVQHLVVQMKEEVEKIKEQINNVI